MGNLKALCGTGISGLNVGVIGIGNAVSGIYQACDKIPVAQDELQRLNTILDARLEHAGNSSDEVSLDIKATKRVRRTIQGAEVTLENDEEIGDLSTRRLQSEPHLSR